MTGLRKLGIHLADFADVPAGPYLSRLDSLILEHCSLANGVPAALGAASRLRHLSIRGWCRCGGLTTADVALLGSLPALATLILDQPSTMEEAQWAEGLAQLRAAVIAQGRAPPSVVCLDA